MVVGNTDIQEKAENCTANEEDAPKVIQGENNQKQEECHSVASLLPR